MIEIEREMTLLMFMVVEVSDRSTPFIVPNSGSGREKQEETKGEQWARLHCRLRWP